MMENETEFQEKGKDRNLLTDSLSKDESIKETEKREHKKRKVDDILELQEVKEENLITDISENEKKKKKRKNRKRETDASVEVQEEVKEENLLPKSEPNKKKKKRRNRKRKPVSSEYDIQNRSDPVTPGNEQSNGEPEPPGNEQSNGESEPPGKELSNGESEPPGKELSNGEPEPPGNGQNNTDSVFDKNEDDSSDPITNESEDDSSDPISNESEHDSSGLMPHDNVEHSSCSPVTDGKQKDGQPVALESDGENKQNDYKQETPEHVKQTSEVEETLELTGEDSVAPKYIELTSGGLGTLEQNQLTGGDSVALEHEEIICGDSVISGHDEPTRSVTVSSELVGGDLAIFKCDELSGGGSTSSEHIESFNKSQMAPDHDEPSNKDPTVLELELSNSDPKELSSEISVIPEQYKPFSLCPIAPEYVESANERLATSESGELLHSASVTSELIGKDPATFELSELSREVPAIFEHIEPFDDHAATDDHDKPSNEGAAASKHDKPSKEGAAASEHDKPSSEDAAASEHDKPSNEGAAASEHDKLTADYGVIFENELASGDPSILGHEKLDDSDLTNEKTASDLENVSPHILVPDEKPHLDHHVSFIDEVHPCSPSHTDVETQYGRSSSSEEIMLLVTKSDILVPDKTHFHEISCTSIRDEDHPSSSSHPATDIEAQYGRSSSSEEIMPLTRSDIVPDKTLHLHEISSVSIRDEDPPSSPSHSVTGLETQYSNSSSISGCRRFFDVFAAVQVFCFLLICHAVCALFSMLRTRSCSKQTKGKE